MSEQPDHSAIQLEVERLLPAMEHSSIEELLSAVGSIPLEHDHEDELRALGVADLKSSGMSLRGIGERFALYNSKVQGVVCRNKDNFSSLIDGSNVTALVLVLLPVLGLPVAAPPAAVVALAVVILRVGLNEYCKSFKNEPSPSTAG